MCMDGSGMAINFCPGTGVGDRGSIRSDARCFCMGSQKPGPALSPDAPRDGPRQPASTGGPPLPCWLLNNPATGQNELKIFKTSVVWTKIIAYQ
jgi:hypothetical protein